MAALCAALSDSRGIFGLRASQKLLASAAPFLGCCHSCSGYVSTLQKYLGINYSSK